MAFDLLEILQAWRKCNPMVNLSKFTYNKKILSEVVALKRKCNLIVNFSKFTSNKKILSDNQVYS